MQDKITLRLKKEKKKWEDFMAQNNYVKVYRLTLNGTWYNLDKYINRPFMTYTGTVETPEQYIQVHLFSLKAKIHQHQIVPKGCQFTFRFLKNEPFTIIVHKSDGKTLKEKSFDGTKSDLGIIEL